MAWFASSKLARSSRGNRGTYTRQVTVTGRCPCGRTVEGKATVTTVLGEVGEAVVTTTHSCGASVRLTGDY